ncbi:hypothetical protein ACWEOW_22805 [Monashia sp. NPDC004114]
MRPTLVSILVLLLLLGACSLWVLEDARTREDRGHPVVASVGGYTIDRPEIWAALSLLVCVLAVPMYLVARRANG